MACGMQCVIPVGVLFATCLECPLYVNWWCKMVGDEPKQELVGYTHTVQILKRCGTLIGGPNQF